jgi:hypothetical protein
MSILSQYSIEKGSTMCEYVCVVPPVLENHPFKNVLCTITLGDSATPTEKMPTARGYIGHGNVVVCKT